MGSIFKASTDLIILNPSVPEEHGSLATCFPKLELLNLERNLLSSLDSIACLKDLPALKNLILSRNRLQAVPPLPGLPNVSHLNLR